MAFDLSGLVGMGAGTVGDNLSNSWGGLSDSIFGTSPTSFDANNVIGGVDSMQQQDNLFSLGQNFGMPDDMNYASNAGDFGLGQGGNAAGYGGHLESYTQNVPGSQGLLSQGWDGLTSKQGANGFGMLKDGYGLYQANRSQNMMEDYMGGMDARANQTMGMQTKQFNDNQVQDARKRNLRY